MTTCVINSPVGHLRITEEDGALTSLSFSDAPLSLPSSPLLGEAVAQLRSYFAGERTTFELPIHFTGGTAFQQAVWNAMLTIPYGQTLTYGQIAAIIGRPKAVRAVGGACHVNPISVIVPCHRVVGKTGLTGYGGGLERKRFLLNLEQHP